MDFLASLKEAMAEGISKDEYMEIWNSEMNLMRNNTSPSDRLEDVTPAVTSVSPAVTSVSPAVTSVSPAVKSVTPAVTSVSPAVTSVTPAVTSVSPAVTSVSPAVKSVNSGDKEREDCTEKEDRIISLLTKIVKQQSKTHQQQTRIEQQLKDLQSSHDKEQQKMQQQFEMTQDIISEKVLALGNALASLQQSFAQCVRQSVYSESLDVQEKLSLMTDTIYNQILKEMRTLLHGMTGDISSTPLKADIIRKKQVQTNCHMSEESIAQSSTKVHHHNASDDCSDGAVLDDCKNACVGDENEKIHLSNTEEAADGVEKVSFISDCKISGSFRQTLCYELNAFLVSIQKLLLRPLNAEDISFYITDKMKEIFQQERNFTTNQLLHVQTAISGDIHARLYKIEMYFKQEFERSRTENFEQNEKLKLEFNKMLEEMHKLKSYISLELPTRMMPYLDLASVPVKEIPSGLDERKVRDLEGNKVIRHESTQELTEVSQLGKEMLGGGNNKPDWNDEDNTNLCPKSIILMSIMYMLTLLLYRDTLGRKNTSEAPQKCAVSEIPSNTSSRDTPCEPLESNTASKGSAKKAEMKHEFSPQKKAVPKEETNAHLKLMLGHYKESKYLCKMKYSKFTLKEYHFILKDIDPGYNIQLQVNTEDDKSKLHFYIMSFSGKHDESLSWPAEFSITIMLGDKKCSKQDKWQNFTKTKLLLKPIKSTGYSKPTPLCYFRESIIDNELDNDTLTFHIAVQYIGDQDKTL